MATHLADMIAPMNAITPTVGLAASTNAVGAIYDTQGAGVDGVLVLVHFGAIVTGGAQSVLIEHGDAANMSDAATVSGSGHTVTDAQDNTIFITDIRRPKKRYLRLTVARATQFSTVSAVYIGYGTRNRPAAQTAASVTAVTRLTAAGDAA